jgi:hypothetical protein
MHHEKGLFAALEAAEDEAVKERLSTAVERGLLTSAEANQRFAYIKRARERYLRRARLLRPKVFISFAGDVGEELSRKAYAAVRKTQACPYGPHFEVENGMRDSGHPLVMEHIRLHLNRCCLFLGIVTAETPLAGGNGSSAPGAWVLIEAGMATALEIPCVLLVEETVHESFWKEQLGSWRHVRFSRSAPEGDLNRAMLILQEHFEAESRKRSAV